MNDSPSPPTPDRNTPPEPDPVEPDSSANALEVLSAKDYRLQLGPVVHEDWFWAAAQGRIPAWVARCPRHIWRVDKANGRVFDFWAECLSFLCSINCAEKRVDQELNLACMMFQRQERIWVAVVDFDEHLVERLRKRRERAGGVGCFTVYRDRNNQLHIYSSADLSSSRASPIRGEWLSPAEALDRLICKSLLLPGVNRPRWTGLWKRPPKPRKESRSFDLGSHPDDLMEEAMAAAEKELEREQGIDALERFSTEEIEEIWLPILKAAIDYQWEIRKEEAFGEGE